MSLWLEASPAWLGEVSGSQAVPGWAEGGVVSPAVKCTGIAWDLVKTQILTWGQGR